MRLISFNYSQQNETTVIASSQNINFPVSNVKHEHRAKEWRSSGNFTVTSANNSISFIEGATTFDATIPAGTYTVSTLKAALQAAMNTAGAYTYTVSYAENSGIWTIAASSSFSLLGTAANSIVLILGYNATDRVGTSIAAPMPAIHTEEYVTFDLKTTEEIDSIALLWGSGNYNLSSDAVIRVQASATNNFSSPAIDQVLTFNNAFEIASHYFTAAQNYRYWRVLIQDSGNVLTYVNLGVVVLGLGESVDNPDNGFTFTQSDNSRITQTDFGQEYVDVYPILKNLQLDFTVMEYSTAEKFMKIYSQLGNRSPVFVAVDAAGAVFNKDCFSLYGKFNGSLNQKHTFYNIFNTGLSIREIN